MDSEVIEQKLESLRRCLQRIQEKCPPSAETLAKDFDMQDIVALNLTRAIQLCVDIGAHLIAGKDTPHLPPWVKPSMYLPCLESSTPNWPYA